MTATWEYGVRYGRSAVYAWGGTHEACIAYASRCDETWGAGTHTVVRRPKPTMPAWEPVEIDVTFHCGDCGHISHGTPDDTHVCLTPMRQIPPPVVPFVPDAGDVQITRNRDPE